MIDKNQIDNSFLISKIEDKINESKTKNRITYSDFLQLGDLSIIKKYIIQSHISNCFYFGGIENADRQ